MPDGIKREVIERIRSERAELERALAEVGIDRMHLPGVENGWTVKDILVQITAGERRLVAWLTAAEHGEPPTLRETDLPWSDSERLNAETYAENRDRPIDMVIAEFHQVYHQALQAIEMLPGVAFTDPRYAPWTGERTLMELIAASTYEHYQKRQGSIWRWLERQDAR